MKYLVIKGEIFFYENEAHVNLVEKIQLVDKDKLDDFCEDGTGADYVIPEMYDGRIIFKPHCLTSEMEMTHV